MFNFFFEVMRFAAEQLAPVAEVPRFIATSSSDCKIADRQMRRQTLSIPVARKRSAYLSWGFHFFLWFYGKGLLDAPVIHIIFKSSKS